MDDREELLKEIKKLEFKLSTSTGEEYLFTKDKLDKARQVYRSSMTKEVTPVANAEIVGMAAEKEITLRNKIGGIQINGFF